MKTILILSALLSTVLFFLKQDAAPGSIPLKGYTLLWKDEFNGNHLDKTKWNYRGLGKRRDAFNSPEAISLDGKGHLIIEAKVKKDTVLAGIIDTQGVFETRYGYFECRASLTKTAGIWPAFWLNSSKNGNGGTPEKNGAEIDIFEYFINDKKDFVCHTLHYGGYGATHQVAGPAWSPLKNTKDGFHTFGLEWTPFNYSVYVDGVKTLSTISDISRVPEFILLSLEVDEKVAGRLNKSELPDRFVVDYVRVYKKIK